MTRNAKKHRFSGDDFGNLADVSPGFGIDRQPLSCYGTPKAQGVLFPVFLAEASTESQ
jgi:hypothetical protein